MSVNLDRYAHHGPLVLADDPALLIFSDLPELIREQSERHAPKQVPVQNVASKDALGRNKAHSGRALGPSDMRVGINILHKKLGQGVIVSIEGQGDGMDVEIRFNDSGIKKFKVIYANLFAYHLRRY